MLTNEMINQNIGKYIRFEGFGIMDGLKQSKNKASFYKIVGLSDSGLKLRRFCSRFNSTLPEYNYNQGFEIIDPKEYKTLPKY